MKSDGRLDLTDRRIITALRHDGRVTISDLREVIKLSMPAISERLKKMESNGVIAKYIADIDVQRALGMKRVLIQLKTKSNVTGEMVDEICKDIVYVDQTYKIYGTFDTVMFAFVHEYVDLFKAKDLLNACEDIIVAEASPIAEKIDEKLDFTRI